MKSDGISDDARRDENGFEILDPKKTRVTMMGASSRPIAQ